MLEAMRFSAFVLAPTLLAAGLLLTPTAPVAAQTASPMPTISPSIDIANCPVGVLAVLPLRQDDPSGQPGQDFVAFLVTNEDAGMASGSLWVNASGVAYRVPFKNRVVLGKTLKGPIDAVAFHLPVEASLENAFVNSLDDPAPALCNISNSWTPQFTHVLRKDILKKLRAVTPTESVDAQVIDDPPTACNSRSLPASTVQAVPPNGIPGLSGDVVVLVTLRADSAILSTIILKSSSTIFNGPSLKATRASVYQTAIAKCRVIPATYRFIVSFAAR
jgi:hypothetical protein